MAVIDVDTGKEIRCPACNKLLLKGTLARGTSIEMVCTRRSCPLRQAKEKIRIRVM